MRSLYQRHRGSGPAASEWFAGKETIMSTMTNKMSEASHKPPVDEGVGSPKKGDVYRCAKCGMAIQVTADCRCQQPGMVHFHCCGQELQRV
jgi:hypothetical protein